MRAKGRPFTTRPLRRPAQGQRNPAGGKAPELFARCPRHHEAQPVCSAAREEIAGGEKDAGRPHVGQLLRQFAADVVVEGLERGPAGQCGGDHASQSDSAQI